MPADLSTKRFPSISFASREVTQTKNANRSRDVADSAEVTSSREVQMQSLQKQEGFLSRIPEVTSSEEAKMTSRKAVTDDEDEDVQVDVDDEEQLWD